MHEVQRIFVSEYDGTPNGKVDVNEELLTRIAEIIKQGDKAFIKLEHYALYSIEHKRIIRVVPSQLIDMDYMINRVAILANEDGSPVYNHVYIIKAKLNRKRDKIAVQVKPGKKKTFGR